MSNKVRSRFAPSPTGHLHIGSARTALFSFLLARKERGDFIIRIEDTDQARNVENAEGKLLQSLKWLGIEWDESVDVGGEYGPYRSMDRLDTYEKYYTQLIEEGKAFRCYCTPEEIEVERQISLEKGETPKYSGKCRHLSSEQRANYEEEGRKSSIRFRVPEDQIIKIYDMVRGEVEFESNGIGDFVIIRPDGIPTYNFAVTIDDHLMEISHVVRGEEHLSNTPRQVLIYQAFGWDIPKFGHLSLILNDKHQKMSKRDESIIQFVEQYKELGFLPEAIINFVALLGWSPEGEEEILSMEQLIEGFSMDRVSKSPAVFDIQKLFWMNNQYIKKAPLALMVDLCTPHLQKAGYIPTELTAEQKQWAEQLIELYQDRLNYAQEIVNHSKIFFDETVQYGDEEKEVLVGEHIPVVMETFKQQITILEDYTPDSIQQALKSVQKETGYKGKQLFMPVRVVATGTIHGPDLQKTLYLLGKEKVLNRIDSLLTNTN